MRQAEHARTIEVTLVPGVGRASTGVLRAVTGRTQLMRQRSHDG